MDSDTKDKIELIPLFTKFRCTDKFGRKWLLFLPEDLDHLPTDATLTQALAEILSIPPLGFEQVEEGKIWFSPNHQIAYRFGYPNEPIKRYEAKGNSFIRLRPGHLIRNSSARFN